MLRPGWQLFPPKTGTQNKSYFAHPLSKLPIIFFQIFFLAYFFICVFPAGAFIELTFLLRPR